MAESTVTVAGLGGMGSSCVEALARGGMGNLILIDGDVVESSNLNRQALAFVPTVGRVKAEVMEAMTADTNPDCTTYTRQISLIRENLAETFEWLPRPDYITDAIDDVIGKIEAAQWCAENRVHLTSVMGGGNKLDLAWLTFSKINKTKARPPAKAVRQVCIRRRTRGPEVPYSSEEPVRVADKGSGAKVGTLNTMSYIPPTMGQMLVGKAIRRLLGLEETPLAPRIGGPADENQPPTER